MDTNTYLISIMFLAFICPTSSNWWYIKEFDNRSITNAKILCQTIPNIESKQREICNRRSDIILTIGESTRNAIVECQFHFKYHKWNCTTFSRDPSVFGKNFVKGGTRELSFVQAMTTASAVLSVAKGCSSGNIGCGCTLKTVEENNIVLKGQFKWHGCMESTKFGINFVRKFVDSAEISRIDTKAKMTLYNNKAGREAVMRHSSKTCKCHGLSGSCTMKTCWRILPNIRTIGTFLKRNYDEAIKIELNPKGQITTVDSLQKKPTKTSLIYYEDSPDGCSLDYSRGYLGTSTRLCNASSDGIDSCDILCCSRNWETKQVSISYNCECNFIWCCEVKCKACQEWVSESRCKEVDGEVELLPEGLQLISGYKKRPSWHKYYEPNESVVRSDDGDQYSPESKHSVNLSNVGFRYEYRDAKSLSK